MLCGGLRYFRSWSLEDEYRDDGKLTERSAERFDGAGTIQPSHYGRYSLSFLGSKRTHTSVDVVIHKSEARRIVLVPMKAKDDLDLSWDEHFALEIPLDGKAFDELRNELRSDPALSVIVSVTLDRMRGLYATWSPSISDGRVLKFLNDPKDVKNQEELPEDFSSVGFGDDLPFSITVGQQKIEDDDEER